MNLQSLQWTTNVTEITWYRKLIPVKKISLGGTLTWQTFVLADCNREVKADVKTSYWNKLMRVQNGVLENESISSSCQVWCLTTREWVNNHCYFVSFEHSVSLQVLHSHIVTDLASSSWGEFEVLGGGIPPKCAWIKHCVGDMMGCDHPICVPVGPLVGELWHFEYFPTWRPSAILNFKNFNI